MGNILKIKIFKIEKDLKIIEAKNLIEQAEKNVNDFIKYKKSSIKSINHSITYYEGKEVLSILVSYEEYDNESTNRKFC
ncbi:hypothetical protein XF24_00105 [candidate division SR1 bacterium Aalborg_AAW-1]|nr:hypothetical protein XF24_00105 [candidate division SR1 bacterium Aalborg_AAW-1]